MKLTPEEMRAAKARATHEDDQWLAGLRDNPEFSLGGYPLSGDPTKRRAMHVDVGSGTPRCAECGVGIFGDEGWLPNECPLTDDGRHTYPNGDKAPMSPRQRAFAAEIAALTGEEGETD